MYEVQLAEHDFSTEGPLHAAAYNHADRVVVSVLVESDLEVLNNSEHTC